MNIAPLKQTEYDILAKCLEGDTPELELLRYQLDSVRYESSFYRPRSLFGFQRHRSPIRRRGGSIRLKVDFGEGSEDWMLGERRRLVIQDVVAETKAHDLLRFELEVEHGLISKLKVASGAYSDTGELQRIRKRIDKLELERLAFVTFEASGESIQLSEHRSQSNYMHLSPPQMDIAPMNEWQRWVLSMDKLRIPRHAPDGKEHLPWTVRRGQPASSSELEALEARYGIVLPAELAEFWSVTNGASFLGRPLRGSYDTVFLDWPGASHILFVEDLYGDGTILTLEVGGKGSISREKARAFQYEASVQEPVRKWASLRECMEELLEEIQREEPL